MLRGGCCITFLIMLLIIPEEQVNIGHKMACQVLLANWTPKTQPQKFFWWLKILTCRYSKQVLHLAKKYPLSKQTRTLKEQAIMHTWRIPTHVVFVPQDLKTTHSFVLHSQVRYLSINKIKQIKKARQMFHILWDNLTVQPWLFYYI